jgi:hypothetical protein
MPWKTSCWSPSRTPKKGCKSLAKAKKKRLAKESDKLWRQAKYWEWLRLAEREGLDKAQPAQWREAWLHLSRWALRLPGNLEEFWQRLAERKNIPDTPDIVLIRRLKDLWEDKDVRPDIAALTGLSPAAQLLRNKLLSWSWDAAQDKKIGKLIKILLNQPEKVTGRVFAELGTLLHPSPLAASLQALSKGIAQVRRFNSKSARGNPNWVGLSDRELKILDNRLERIAGSLDPVLREVLLYPFLYQAVRFFERLVAREDFTQLARLTAVVPFLFSQAAGPQAEYLKNRCRQLAGEIASEPEARDYLKQALTQDLETKVAALGKVRLALKSLDPSERLLQEFYLLYQRVLDGIDARQKELSPREKRDLMRLMDPLILGDLVWLPDEPHELGSFVNKTIDSGCGGALICTLALVQRASARDLREKALAILQELPYPGDQQIIRVLKSLGETIFPHARLIKPLLELYPTEAGLRKLLFDWLLDEVKMFLLTNTMTVDFEKSNKIKAGLKSLIQEALIISKNNLNYLKNYEEVVVLQDLLECFPEGYLTTNGYHSLFLKLHSREQNFDYFFSQLDKYLPQVSEALDLDNIFFNVAAGDRLDTQEELLFHFVIDYCDDLQIASLDTIELIIDRFCQPRFMAPNGLNFFLSLSNRLEERLQAGESAAKDLRDRIMSLLLEYRQTTRRTRRTRK